MFGDLIIHEKIQSAPYGISISIKAFLNVSETEFHRFSLLYRPFGNIEYIETPMIQIGKFVYSAEIPGEFIMREFLEYYLLLEMPNQTETFFPLDDAMKNPIRINIEIPEKELLLENPEDSISNDIQDFDIVGLNPEVVIISPKAGERIIRKDLFIALSYFSMEDIDLSRIRVYLDEIDVSEKAAIESSYLSVPTEAITPGIHTIRINITNIFGQKYNDVSWSFTVLPGKTQSFGTIKKQTSQLQANYTGSHVDKSAVDIGEINFHHNIDFDWLLMDVHYSKLSLENKFAQPYDRYYVHFSNEFMKIKLGDSYPYIDDYAWNGRRVRGINFSFDKGPLSIEVINGKTARAVQGNPADNAMFISAIDSTTDNWGITISRNNYIFQQDVSAAKVGLTLGEKVHWDMNYIKIQDNIPTVIDTISNAEIFLPDEILWINPNLSNLIMFSDLKSIYDTTSSNQWSLNVPTTNWAGQKPKDNFIFGSNLQFGFDDSRILINSGFSLSLLNRNKWNNIENISELDTLAYDSTGEDGMFLYYVELDTSLSISQYESYISFGKNGQPLIPSILQIDNLGLNDILNLSYLNRYTKLQLRYVGHRVELGSKWNGPDYYSLLNPSLKTNYKETYFSDRLNLFQNKLLLYYKRSKITEGLYVEQSNSIEIRKSLFNIALYPGNGLPAFNFGFVSSNRNNGIKNLTTVIDTINPGTQFETIIIESLDNRIDLASKQFNISMTNQFQLWGDQILSMNILLFDQEDIMAENVSKSHPLYMGYLPKDATSESYGISLKSVYNSHWESSVYFNSSYYDYGQIGFDYNGDGLDDYKQQVLKNYQFKLAYHPRKYVKKLVYGLHYSTGKGDNDHTQYNCNIGITSEPIDKIKLKILFDYRIKYLGESTRSSNDIFFRANILYNIL